MVVVRGGERGGRGSVLTCRHDRPSNSVGLSLSSVGLAAGAPLVVSPAEGATRRSVTASRDQPAPQPLQEPLGARIDTCCNAAVAKSPTGPRNSHSPRTGSASEGGELSVSMCLYAPVSQERSNRLDLRESPFIPLTRMDLCMA